MIDWIESKFQYSRIQIQWWSLFQRPCCLDKCLFVYWYAHLSKSHMERSVLLTYFLSQRYVHFIRRFALLLVERNYSASYCMCEGWKVILVLEEWYFDDKRTNYNVYTFNHSITHFLSSLICISFLFRV